MIPVNGDAPATRLEELVPDLRDLAPYGQITQEVVRKLAVNCLAVLEPAA